MQIKEGENGTGEGKAKLMILFRSGLVYVEVGEVAVAALRQAHHNAKSRKGVRNH
jgi:hypothetical protein